MTADEVFIHPTAVVPPQAQLDSGVYIGPHCVIGPEVKVGKRTKLEANVYLGGWTTIGEECVFSPYSSVGTEPQDLTYKGERTLVKIGKRNIFREFITINRGAPKGGGITSIGDDNYFMAYSHIAHDCQVGNHTVFINGATLAGHVEVDDFATVGAFSAIHQFCRVGKYAFIGGYSVITQDVCPFLRVAGSRPTWLYGVNAIGLRRQGFSRERINLIKKMIKLLFYSELNTSQAVEKITQEVEPTPDREEILVFIQNSTRGLVKKVAEPWMKNWE